MTAPSLEPEHTAADLLAGRANLLRDIAIFLATWDYEEAFACICVTPHGVEFQAPDYRVAVAVAETFGAAPQCDRSTRVLDGWVYAREHWVSDVLTVAWCKRLEVAVG